MMTNGVEKNSFGAVTTDAVYARAHVLVSHTAAHYTHTATTLLLLLIILNNQTEYLMSE